MIEKNNLLKAGCLLPAAVSIASCSVNIDQTGTPTNKDATNIIFILADDLGYGELSCYNPASFVQTPNIDRLASGGVLMTQAYATPVSSPTRSCFLTGRFPQHVGVYGNPDGTIPGIGPFRSCFAEVLQHNGYSTAWFGKWHQGWDVSSHPLNNGFDRTYGFLGGMHDYYNPAVGDDRIGGPYARHAFVYDDLAPVEKMDYLTTELTDQFIDYINTYNREKPFFAYMAYNAPHTPLQAPENVVRKYLDQGHSPIFATRLALTDVLDQEIGRLVEALEKAGLRENTLIVFMSDNGPEQTNLTGGLRGRKMTVWEGGVRVPLIASYPGHIPAGQRCNSICSIVDMAATFIGLTKGQNDYKFGDGRSLMPYFKGDKQGNVHNQLVFSIHLKGAAHAMPDARNLELFGVRSGDWKLVVDKTNKVDALYNLQDDLAEQNDLSSAHPDIKNKLYNEGNEFLHHSLPSCSKIHSEDTRGEGDQIIRDSLNNKYN